MPLLLSDLEPDALKFRVFETRHVRSPVLLEHVRVGLVRDRSGQAIVAFCRHRRRRREEVNRTLELGREEGSGGEKTSKPSPSIRLRRRHCVVQGARTSS